MRRVGWAASLDASLRWHDGGRGISWLEIRGVLAPHGARMPDSNDAEAAHAVPAMSETRPRHAGEARFISGSTMRHVVVMTMTGAVGLMSIFIVDLINLYFLSLLGDPAITAAIGFAGTLLFVNISFALGTGIAAAALVSRHVGAGEREHARRLATNSLVVAVSASLALTTGMAIFADPILRFLGASGPALEHARLFVWTASPGLPMISAAIACSFTMRAIADPVRAMHVTLASAIVDGCLAPLFIFGFGLSIQGAALSIVCADAASLAVALYGLAGYHRFLARFTWPSLLADIRAIFNIASAAVLTQLATPFAVAYLMLEMAAFGDEAVSAATIVNRLTPVAFGIIFSLSGAVGPILGQNFGARLFDRVKRALTDSLLFAASYTALTSAILFLFRYQIPDLFRAEGLSSELVTFYCTWLAATWIFTGAQFVSQAAFNNLGRPHWSTAFNWARSTLGTIPFVYLGARLGGAHGVLIGSAIGSLIFGLAATLTAYWLVHRIAAGRYGG